MIQLKILGVAVIAMAATTSQANWTVTVLHDDAIATGLSRVTSIGPNLAVGVTTDPSGVPYPTAWTPAAQNWLAPGYVSGQLLATDGASVGGYLSSTSGFEAFWYPNGAATGVRLHLPSRMSSSDVRGVFSGTQVGRARLLTNNADVAVLWSGTARSWKNLHPKGGYTNSVANAISNDKIGGVAYTATYGVACAWEGPKAKFRPLSAVESEVLACSNAYYGGNLGNWFVASSAQAYLWSTTTSNQWNLADPSWLRSRVTGISEDMACVTAVFADGSFHGLLYDLFTLTYIDLNTILDTQYSGQFVPGTCQVSSISRNAFLGTVLVGGSARRASDNKTVAVVFSYAP